MSDIEDSLRELIKALEAGSYNAAPGSLVGGGPLQIEALEDLYPHTASGEELDRMANEAGLMRICSHEWIEYTGLNECYSYCKHCDKKAISDRK